MALEFDFKRETRPAAPHRLHLDPQPHDGDTPTIDQAIRMVSVDTPEKAQYAGKPETAQPKLDRTRQRLTDGTYDALPADLRDYLVDKLTPDAAARHIAASDRATTAFIALLTERLTRPTGTVRRTGVIPTGEIIDTHGRMLAYLVPWYDSDELPADKNDPKRRTFNLDMVANGWGAPFMIYPSLPKNDDLHLFMTDARVAWDEPRGAWDEFGRDVLLGYEYRMCIKLADVDDPPAAAIKNAFERSCVDLRTVTDVGPYGWADVPPPERLWYWTKDAEAAKADLGLA
jgi:endonuclease YncB( thermonuclease family)